ncbi:imidazole glycerol phosphate synthase subunit HisH [Clostridium gasigenes]|uniref:imidazole glycerol phosphate synthase subunit HisH n=1 Tax=Clostridium gasigenes TaxID=94869 RepID=UPI0014385ECA|nr:imidazole glycerol phosphate synthase subunit HisH [Clostridium gasigenes]NKF06251.1 imidazole glycerol phosphate synthase subunit HisH [Clostridium gasigenes]QSW20139.1 imidazole glycerol phosphate synthase subunit HisH [Clostridium gasigenes]
MIVIIDYGMGNLKSVYNALKVLGLECKISSSPNEIRAAKALILPGVGAFKEAMDNLCENSLDKVIKEECAKGKFLLGICLGMQMLFNKGYESEETEGLGLLHGDIVKMEPKEEVKIPHMGWNSLDFNKQDIITKGLTGDSFVYYVHSFYVKGYNNEDLVASSSYGELIIPGIVRRGNIIGAQFHPEKSGDIGLKILKNFGEMIK